MGCSSSKARVGIFENKCKHYNYKMDAMNCRINSSELNYIIDGVVYDNHIFNVMKSISNVKSGETNDTIGETEEEAQASTTCVPNNSYNDRTDSDLYSKSNLSNELMKENSFRTLKALGTLTPSNKNE